MNFRDYINFCVDQIEKEKEICSKLKCDIFKQNIQQLKKELSRVFLEFNSEKNNFK
jgi:hypothetical protein